MSSTTFVDGQTVIFADWLNDVNDFVYENGVTSAQLANSTGSSLVGFIQSGAGAQQETVQQWIRWNDVNVMDFLTPTERAAVEAFTFATDVTAGVQAALNHAHATNRNCYAPAGGYLVTGLVLPGTVDGVSIDERSKACRFYGQGYGEAFSTVLNAGTIFKSVTNAPILTDIIGTPFSSNGTWEIDHIRFDGTSNGSVPVIELKSFYGQSSFHHNVIFQRGTGGGLKTGWGATVNVYENYCMNRDFLTSGVGAARVGIGFEYAPTGSNGLVTFYKNTARGWLTGFVIGGAAGTAYSTVIDLCECSMTRNGIRLLGTGKALVTRNYTEEGDGGTGIFDDGDYSTIKNNLIFPGFAVGISSINVASKGTLIDGNTIGLGSVVNAVGIDYASDAPFGGFNKNVTNNYIARVDGTAGQIGIRCSGISPRTNETGNSMDPKGVWAGAGAVKYADLSTSERYGLVTRAVGPLELPHLTGAIVSLHDGAVLTESNVSSNNMTVPQGNLFAVTATVPTTVQRFTMPDASTKEVSFRTTNSNTTFTDTAYNQLAGGTSFTGPGIITFVIGDVAGSAYAWEKSRTVF